jgi:hypothetical protein
MNPDNVQIIIAVSTLVGGLIGFFVKYILEKNKELASENNKIKRTIYKKFTSIVFDLFNNEIKVTNKDLKTNLSDFYKDYVLYSSPKVIKVFGDYMQYLYKSGDNINIKVSMQKLSKIIVAMRRELGLSNRGLGKNGIYIFKAYFKDFDAIKK